MIGFAAHRLMELSLTVAAHGETQRWRIQLCGSSITPGCWLAYREAANPADLAFWHSQPLTEFHCNVPQWAEKPLRSPVNPGNLGNGG
jgi:hypothetical protein